MAKKVAILFLVCLFNLSSGYVIMDDEDYAEELLNLPSEYSIKAERIDLVEDNKLPLQLWYSLDYNRSRVDVYNGMVRRYYYWGSDGPMGTDGKVYVVYPKWTENKGHTIICVKWKDDPFQPMDVFPPEEEYVYLGKKRHEGKELDMWKFTEDYSDTRREVVLYSYKETRGEDVPVQVEVIKMNTLKGSIDNHIILNYEEYNPIFCEEEVNAEKDGDCEWSPGDFDGHMQMLHPAFHGHLDKAFNSFKNHHRRVYQNKEEHEKRKAIFHKNWQLVVDHNRQDLGFKLALNHFSDLTAAERAHMKGARRSANPSATHAFPHSTREVTDSEEGELLISEIPEEYDMRLEGFISPIKNQGDCGSCWAFATTAAVEGALAKANDGLILDLSEQSIMDCSWEGGNEGCDGGSIKRALEFVFNYGLPLEDEYGGYLAQNGYCHEIENMTEKFEIRGFNMLTPPSFNALKMALIKYGPVVVTIQSNDAFDFYSSGIFYDLACVDDHINHAVTIVGYGVRDGEGYWLVKNSYGQRWGVGGYMLLSQFNNNCVVLNEPYYPVV